MAKLKKKQRKINFVFETDSSTNDCTETFKYLTIHNEDFWKIISDENILD